MIQMRVGEQYVVDGGGGEAKGPGVFRVQFAATLMQPAIDQDALAAAFDQMTGAGDTAIGAMKGQFQVTLPIMRRSRRNDCNGSRSGVRQSANRGAFRALAA
jgi:hypothetical protein